MSSDGTEEGKSSVYRRGFLGSVGAVGATGLAGCSGGGGGETEQPTTSGSGGGGQTQQSTTTGSASNENVVFHLITDSSNPTQKKVLRNAFDDWAETVDANVQRNFEFLSFQGARNKLNTTMAAGNPPNLIFLDMSAASRWRSKLEGLPQIFSNLGVASQLTVRNNNDEPVFIPHDFGLAYKWVRSDIYEDAGVELPPRSPEDMWTWEENLNNLQTLEDHLSDTEMFPDTVFANPSSWLTSWIGYTDLSTIGANVVEREGGKTSVVIDQEPNRSLAIEAMNFRKQIYQNGWSPNTTTYESSKMISLFYSQQTAGAQYGGRLMVNVERQNPDLAQNLHASPLAVHPNFKNGNSDYKQHMAAAGFWIPKQVENKDLLKNFIEYYYSTDWYIESLLSVPLHKVPLTADIMDKDAYMSNEIVQNHLDLKEFLKEFVYDYGQLTINVTDPPTPYYLDWAEWANQTALPRMFAEAYTGRTDPGQAIDNAAQHLRSTQAKFQER